MHMNNKCNVHQVSLSTSVMLYYSLQNHDKDELHCSDITCIHCIKILNKGNMNLCYLNETAWVLLK